MTDGALNAAFQVVVVATLEFLMLAPHLLLPNPRIPLDEELLDEADISLGLLVELCDHKRLERV